MGNRPFAGSVAFGTTEQAVQAALAELGEMRDVHLVIRDAMSNARVTKRQREKERQDRQREKEIQREERRRNQANRPRAEEGAEDPDIAGIVPGPQKPLTSPLVDEAP